MHHIDPVMLEAALLPQGTPMLSDLIARIEADPALPASRRRDQCSALRRIAEVLGRPLEVVPAHPGWLRPRLEAVAPAAHGLKLKTWSNIRSNLRTALEGQGITTNRKQRPEDLSPNWQAAWSAVRQSDDLTLQRSLPRFVYFLNRLDVRPQDVRSHHAVAFREALELNEISRSPQRLYENAVGAWNLAVDRIPEWPKVRLSRPSRRRILKRPLAEFPESFQSDFTAYLEGLARPDPFAPNGRIKPLSATTIRLYRDWLHRFASILVHAGLPAEHITGLASLVDVTDVKLGLGWMLEQNGGETRPMISETAQLLLTVAARHVGASEAERAELARIADRVSVRRKDGLTKKNRERLRPLKDPARRRQLLRLPDVLFAQAEGLSGRQASLLREQAVAIAILSVCPVRIRNLAGIHPERHIRRPGGRASFLVFEDSEVKNGRHLEFELPPRVLDLIDRHLATRSPGLCQPATPWLFPRRNGQGPMDPNQLSRTLYRRIRTETGLEVNAHLFRHQAALIYLEANPGEYEAVRRLLGHSTMSRVLNAYAGFEAGTATRKLAALVEEGLRP